MRRRVFRSGPLAAHCPGVRRIGVKAAPAEPPLQPHSTQPSQSRHPIEEKLTGQRTALARFRPVCRSEQEVRARRQAPLRSPRINELRFQDNIRRPDPRPRLQIKKAPRPLRADVAPRPRQHGRTAVIPIGAYPAGLPVDTGAQTARFSAAAGTGGRGQRMFWGLGVWLVAMVKWRPQAPKHDSFGLP